LEDSMEIRTAATQGWQCPNCASVYAPQITECAACGEEAAARRPHEPVSNRSAARPPIYARYRC